MIGGTVYETVKGRTLIDGTGYDIPFSKFSILYTGTYNLYGGENQGWIEMLTSGTLTLKTDLLCDIYLLSSGLKGNQANTGDHSYDSTASDAVLVPSGGNGGSYKEIFGVTFDGTEIAVTIGGAANTSRVNQTTLGSYTSSGGRTVGKGGAGATAKNASTVNRGSSGGDGRKPFANNTPMNEGLAQYELGAGGGGAGVYHSSSKFSAGGYGGTYGGGVGGSGSSSANGRYGFSGTANTGSGGGGGGVVVTNSAYSACGGGGYGGSGIAIVRWGY